MDTPKKSSSMTLHAHGDGTYHTVPGGSFDQEGRVEHETFGHAVMHMAKHHAPRGEDHIHVNGHENGYRVHHTADGSKPKMHDAKNIREMKKTISNFLDEEGAE